ncbi:hypothetical protein CLPU_8c01360 [Gottschalkia purinilytica]|uniref:Uncharacterized protein n=1 Tax=Gottschalkia purinilytica TaxID=1503 RepID=A0A0L0WA72_GOTPU|nr:ETX/MTX2 family pore-forming toxin [Gottschalkia purinilytica]KNF08371.1 hypothetical protein CLPU_8c01360 [Gottschalkia purinilytica]
MKKDFIDGNDEDSTSLEKEVSSDSQKSIVDIDAKLNNMVRSFVDNFNKQSNFHLIYTDFTYSNVLLSGTNLESTNVTKTRSLSFASSTLHNDTDQTQTLYSDEFSYTFTNSRTTTTTHGGTFGTNVNTKIGIPFIAQGELEIKLEYNFSSSNSNTTSESFTLTSPRQPVEVPPHKIYKVDTYYEQKHTSGNVQLNADVEGNIIFQTNINGLPSRPEVKYIGNIYKGASDSVLDGITKSPHHPYAVRLIGQGKFEVEYGRNLLVKVYDITEDKDSPSLVDTLTIKLD